MVNQVKDGKTDETAATYNMRRQHEQLLSICKEIERLILVKDASALALSLSRLTGQLTVHLGMEDKVIYPALVGHADEEVRDMAKRYQDEMGGLAKVYLDYAGKWTHKTIEAQFSEFSRQPKRFFPHSGSVYPKKTTSFTNL